ncbi:hypothetical protein Q5741_02075 [Paenibacillus sp. JX-17]|uniref:Lipoprotein n=1 Tax=Paenibacillus lacisoli TaxID=3064525 RepID=A0ABT9CBZ1_9BACL|nr:hypothetical protein [Paenibacillus sp. JX-17]MDO7905201.1 hypothetical protein [Paenibacillus sp. JX-17]
MKLNKRYYTWGLGGLLLLAGCSSQEASAVPIVGQSMSDDITIQMDGRSLLPQLTKTLKINYKDGLTIAEVLRNEGQMRLSDDGMHISAVAGTTLDPSLAWKIQLNGHSVVPEQWKQKLDKKDNLQIELTAVQRNPKDKPQSARLSVNGGTLNPGLSRAYINVFHDSLTVRDILVNSGLVKLNDNNKAVVSVEGYSPRVNEQWILKVNNKQLITNGLDMKLQPQDIVEIELAST